jgi:hypothetical protein
MAMSLSLTPFVGLLVGSLAPSRKQKMKMWGLRDPFLFADRPLVNLQL